MTVSREPQITHQWRGNRWRYSLFRHWGGPENRPPTPPLGGKMEQPDPVQVLAPRRSRAPTPWHKDEEQQPPEDEDEGDEAGLMQTNTQLNDTAASGSAGEPQQAPRGRPQRRTPQRMSPAAAMVRRWLRQLAAVLLVQPMGDTIPLLLEEAMEVVGTCSEDDRWQDDGTVGGTWTLQKEEDNQRPLPGGDEDCSSSAKTRGWTATTSTRYRQTCKKRWGT